MEVVSLNPSSTPYTYILEWSKLGKRYIGRRWAKGCHPSDLWTKYFSSSKYVAEFVAQNGDPDIILIDKVFGTPQDAMRREQELQHKFDVRHNDSFLNKAIGGVWNHLDSEIIKKMSDAHKGQQHTDEWKANNARIHLGRKRPPETGKRISAAKKGKTFTPEHCEKIRLNKLGKIHSEETKQKMSLAHMGNKSHAGRKLTPEHKQRISKGNRGNKFPMVVCPHCNKHGGESGMKSWHFDYCKHRKKV